MDHSDPLKMWDLMWDQIFKKPTLSFKNKTIKWLIGAQKRNQ